MKKESTHIESILEVKAVGVDVSRDLESNQTKSIAQLIQDEETETEEGG